MYNEVSQKLTSVRELIDQITPVYLRTQYYNYKFVTIIRNDRVCEHFKHNTHMSWVIKNELLQISSAADVRRIVLS